MKGSRINGLEVPGEPVDSWNQTARPSDLEREKDIGVKISECWKLNLILFIMCFPPGILP